MRRIKVIGLVAALSFAALLGSKTAGDPPPKILYIEHTKTVNVPGPEKDIYIIPRLSVHCRIAIKSAKHITSQADKLYEASDKQLDILSHARRVLVESGDTAGLEEDQRKLQGHEIGTLEVMAEELTRINTEMKLCNSDQQENK